MIAILSATHIFSTIRTGFIQIKLFKAIKLSFSKDKGAQGDVSQFGALCTALSGTLGVGCIVGVATAIISGGPGAVFWMWIMGIFGMATKYSETYIALKFRVKDKFGHMCGGAMYTWDEAFKKKKPGSSKAYIPIWAKIGGACFAIFTMLASLGTGCTVQSAAISGSIVYFFPEIPQWTIAIVVCIATGLVVFGGIKVLSSVCERIVPFMTIAFVAGALILLFINHSYILSTIGLILECAFSSKAAFGGAVGSGIQFALQYGMARGLFSNESGLGTAPIVASAATTKNPARQSLVSMTGAFWSTVVICALTGVVIVSSMLSNPDLIAGNSQTLTLQCFQQIPYIGGPLLVISIILFAFSTIIGWSYCSDRAVCYLFGNKAVKIYMTIFVAAVFFGGAGFADFFWNFSDIMNALMALPNLILVFILSGIVWKETKFYVWKNNLDVSPDERSTADFNNK